MAPGLKLDVVSNLTFFDMRADRRSCRCQNRFASSRLSVGCVGSTKGSTVFYQDLVALKT